MHARHPRVRGVGKLLLRGLYGYMHATAQHVDAEVAKNSTCCIAHYVTILTLASMSSGAAAQRAVRALPWRHDRQPGHAAGAPLLHPHHGLADLLLIGSGAEPLYKKVSFECCVTIFFLTCCCPLTQTQCFAKAVQHVSVEGIEVPEVQATVLLLMLGASTARHPHNRNGCTEHQQEHSCVHLKDLDAVTTLLVQFNLVAQRLSIEPLPLKRPLCGFHRRCVRA